MRIFEVKRSDEIFIISGVHLKSGDDDLVKKNRIDEFNKLLN